MPREQDSLADEIEIVSAEPSREGVAAAIGLVSEPEGV
jgi:hypothetical protein